MIKGDGWGGVMWDTYWWSTHTHTIAHTHTQSHTQKHTHTQSHTCNRLYIVGLKMVLLIPFVLNDPNALWRWVYYSALRLELIENVTVYVLNLNRPGMLQSVKGEGARKCVSAQVCKCMWGGWVSISSTLLFLNGVVACGAEHNTTAQVS